jgi:hypothetical protein
MASSGNQQIEEWFPNLKPTDYQITSPPDNAYNCIAWAAGRIDSWWQALKAPGYYWPDHLPFDDRIETIVRVFEHLGFEQCDNNQLENAYEKVAVYGQNGLYEHMARQLPNGKWTSKLGKYHDIEHLTLDGLTGETYGAVAKILRRRIREVR